MFHFTGDHVLMLIIILCFRASVPNKNGIHDCPQITSYRNVLNHNQSADVWNFIDMRTFIALTHWRTETAIRGDEWEPLIILPENLAYIPVSTQSTSRDMLTLGIIRSDLEHHRSKTSKIRSKVQTKELEQTTAMSKQWRLRLLWAWAPVNPRSFSRPSTAGRSTSESRHMGSVPFTRSVHTSTQESLLLWSKLQRRPSWALLLLWSNAARTASGDFL